MASSAQSASKKDDKPASNEPKPEQTQQKSAAALEEDDEFEDFPVDGMSALAPVVLYGLPCCPHLRAITSPDISQPCPHIMIQIKC